MKVVSIQKMQGVYEGKEYEKLIVYLIKDAKNDGYTCKDGTKVELLTGTQVERIKVSVDQVAELINAYNNHLEVEPLFNQYGNCVRLNIETDKNVK